MPFSMLIKLISTFYVGLWDKFYCMKSDCLFCIFNFCYEILRERMGCQYKLLSKKTTSF